MVVVVAMFFEHETDFPHRIKHLPLVNAIGINEEGVQIREVKVTWPCRCEKLSQICPGVGFILKIWQGHVDGVHGLSITLA